MNITPTHALITCPSEYKNDAIKIIVGAWGPEQSQTLSIPLYAIESPTDGAVIAWACAPQIGTQAALDSITQAIAQFPGASLNLYQVGQKPDPVQGWLTAMGLRKALSKPLP